MFLIVVVLAAAAAIMVVIGARLPREHRVERTVRFSRSPSDVWPVISALASGASVPVDVLENNPPHRLVTRVKGSEKRFGGTWIITIAPDNGASIVTITEDGWVNSLPFRFISFYIIGHYATMDALLREATKELGK
jgi:hypothetical protein